MKTTEDIVTELKRRFRNRCQRWLAGDESWPMRLNLHPPTQAQVERDMGAVRQWAIQWAQCPHPGVVESQTFRWGRLGAQTLPTALVLEGPEQAAAWAGQAASYARAAGRFALLRTHWAQWSLAGLEKHYDAWASYEEPDFKRLVAVIDWLLAHPNSGMYLRELPISGIDTKWAETRKSLIVGLLNGLHGEPAGSRDFEEACGLRKKPDVVRMRVLCPGLRARFAGLCDITAPLEELARLDLAPRLVLVTENLHSGLALPDAEDVVAFMARGYTVNALSPLPWVRAAELLYWGDIDTHGFAMLSGARSWHPRVRSMLMDEGTLLAHRALWVEERVQSSAELSRLLPEEQAVYRGLREHRWDASNVRLEQERLGWDLVAAFLGTELQGDAPRRP